ncbi:hypothetical protein J1N35_013614 [Gossypium stocksii]|uniref:DUF4283 domain-containing protein n=1 Tax=Gossypium stocksii TaxID=47602 RepID=A0A9D4A6V6_9ROSI|nr:hypothetical protein J1N35_013614 [Gossypium stocksii]
MENYNRVLSQGPWIVYGQYLTVQPWTKHFSPTKPYPSMVLAWIRLPNLPGHLYKKKIIEAIRSLIRKVVKLDVQTDNQTRGRFAHLAVYINLDQPLIPQVFVDGTLQRVEYEALPTVCFTCESRSKEIEPTYGPWMLVEKRQSRWERGSSSTENLGKQIKFPLGTRFSALMREEDLNDVRRISDADFSKENDKRKEAVGQKGVMTRVNFEKGDFSFNKARYGGTYFSKSGHEDKNLLGYPNGSNLEKDMESGPLGTIDQMSKVALDKHLGKRPISQDGPVNGQEDYSAQLNCP